MHFPYILAAVAAYLHRNFATLYTETPRNFGNSYHDVPTVEYTPISTVHASGSRRMLCRISLFSLTVKGHKLHSNVRPRTWVR